jgi:hypothetical protein
MPQRPATAERVERGATLTTAADRSRSRRRTAVLLAIPPLLAAAWVWHPIVDNYFVGDDFANLFLICNAPLWHYLVTPQVGHVYVVRNAVFYVFAQLFGTDAGAYFTIVWLTHVLNVALLFWTVERFTTSAWIACVCALLFGTCPAVEGTLGWFAVFGHALATTTLLLVLLDVAHLSADGRTPGTRRRWLWAALALSGVTCFGVGVGLAIALPFVLAVLLPQTRRRWLPPLWPLIIVTPLLYVVLYWIHAHIGGASQIAKAHDITSDFVQLAFDVPRFMLDLMAYAIDRLLAGPLPLPPAPAVAGTLFAAGAVLVGLWCAMYGPRSARRLLLASALLTLSCYGPIAAGRIGLLDMMSWADAVSQPRYYYTGLVTLALGLAAILVTFGQAVPALGRRRTPLLAAWLAAWLVALWLLPPPIDHHEGARTEALFLINWMRTLTRQTPADEDVYIPNRGFQAVSPLFFSRVEFPGWAGLFSIYFPDPSIDGRRVFFIEPDPGVRAAHRFSRRLAGALVAPEDVPPLPAPLTPVDPICPVPALPNALAQRP